MKIHRTILTLLSTLFWARIAGWCWAAWNLMSCINSNNMLLLHISPNSSGACGGRCRHLTHGSSSLKVFTSDKMSAWILTLSTGIYIAIGKIIIGMIDLCHRNFKWHFISNKLIYYLYTTAFGRIQLKMNKLLMWNKLRDEGATFDVPIARARCNTGHVRSPFLAPAWLLMSEYNVDVLQLWSIVRKRWDS